MAELSDVEIDDDGEFTATVEFEDGRRVPVDFEVAEELEDLGDEDVDVMLDGEDVRAIVQHAVDRLTASAFEGIEDDIVRELTDAAFEEDDGEPGDEDYEALADDLELDSVLVVCDGTVVLAYLAPEQYPDMTIYAQLDDELAIEGLMVEADG